MPVFLKHLRSGSSNVQLTLLDLVENLDSNSISVVKLHAESLVNVLLYLTGHSSFVRRRSNSDSISKSMFQCHHYHPSTPCNTIVYYNYRLFDVKLLNVSQECLDLLIMKFIPFDTSSLSNWKELSTIPNEL